VNYQKIIEVETLEQRLERMNEYQDKNHGKYPNIQAVRTRPEGSYFVKEWMLGANIVTTAGDVYYAQRGAAATPTNDFAGANSRFTLRNGADTPAKADTYDLMASPVTASRQVIDATYPKTNDGDADNTAASGDKPRIVTYRVSYTTTSFSATGIVGGCIHVGGDSPTTGTAILTHFSIAPFDKTTSDTLKLFVNHMLSGV
jgi:hypothetical protein